MNAIRNLGLALLLCSLATGCNKKNDDSEVVDDSTSNALQSAMGIAGSIANDTEATSARLGSFDRGSVISEEDRAACTWPTLTCSSDVATLTWNSCTIALSTGNATMTGGWTYTYSSGACSSAVTSGLSNGQSVTATTSESKVTFPSGATLTTSTEAHSAYDGTSIPATGFTVSRGVTNRSVTINGLHRVLRGPKGRTWFDHSFKTTSAMTFSGTKAGGDRVVTGTLVYYHNLAQYTGTHTFNSVTWGSSSCSYPTSGSISSTFSGSVSGTATLTFSSTCGSATFSHSTSSPSPAPITLTYKL